MIIDRLGAIPTGSALVSVPGQADSDIRLYDVRDCARIAPTILRVQAVGVLPASRCRRPDWSGHAGARDAPVRRSEPTVQLLVLNMRAAPHPGGRCGSMWTITSRTAGTCRISVLDRMSNRMSLFDCLSGSTSTWISTRYSSPAFRMRSFSIARTPGTAAASLRTASSSSGRPVGPSRNRYCPGAGPRPPRRPWRPPRAPRRGRPSATRDRPTWPATPRHHRQGTEGIEAIVPGRRHQGPGARPPGDAARIAIHPLLEQGTPAATASV